MAPARRCGEFVTLGLAESAANSTTALRAGAAAALQATAEGIGELRDRWRALEANERLDRGKGGLPGRREKALTDARTAADGTNARISSAGP